jgi:hypothetical protein
MFIWLIIFGGHEALWYFAGVLLTRRRGVFGALTAEKVKDKALRSHRMNRCRAECSPNTSLSMLTFVEVNYHAIYDLH